MGKSDKMAGLFRRLAALLCALCVVSLFPFGTSAKADIAGGKTGALSWRLTDAGELRISGTGETASYSGNDVSSAWKPYNDQIRSIVVESGATRIGWCAFMNCRNLVSVSLPGTVKLIDLKAFMNCESLASFTVPAGVKEIGEQAFMNCTALSELTVPAGVSKIGKQAFTNCGGNSSIDDDGFTTRAELEKFWSETGVVLHVEKGSAAEQYARQNRFSCRIGTQFFPGLKKKVLDKADAIIAECVRPGMSEKQIARALHDWIVYHTYYACGRDNFEHLLLSGCGVCMDYAYAYRLLLSRAGLANGIAWGNAQGDSHAWNLVRIDGTWYHIDTTFDDPGTKAVPRSGNENTRYFMLTDKQIAKDHQWEESWLTMDTAYDPGR